MRKIRILHSEFNMPIGGIESFLLNLVKKVDLQKIQFDFLISGHDAKIEKYLESCGVNLYRIPCKGVGYVKFINDILEKNEYDYVHVHKNSAADIRLPILAKKKGIKVITHSHNTYPSTGSKLMMLLHKMNRRRLNKIAYKKYACSEKASEWLYGSDKDVTIIKNGIIADEYRFNSRTNESKRKDMGWAKNKKILIDVAAFRTQKNHKFLIRLMQELNKDDYLLILVGEGELKEDLEKEVKLKKLDKSIQFLGNRSDVVDLLQAADIYVMPSLWEGLPVSAIEAQAAGLPVILSNKISKMTKVTPNVDFLDISSTQEWIKKINKISIDFKRKDTYSYIKENGYDISDSAKIIESNYIEGID